MDQWTISKGAFGPFAGRGCPGKNENLPVQTPTMLKIYHFVNPPFQIITTSVPIIKFEIFLEIHFTLE